MKNYENLCEPYYEKKNPASSFVLTVAIVISILFLAFMALHFGSKAAAQEMFTKEVNMKLLPLMSRYEKYEGCESMDVDIEAYKGLLGSKDNIDIHLFSVKSFKDPKGKVHTDTYMKVYWHHFRESIAYIEVNEQKYGTCSDCFMYENSPYAKRMRQYAEERKRLEEWEQQDRMESLRERGYISPSEGIKHLLGE